MPLQCREKNSALLHSSAVRQHISACLCAMQDRFVSFSKKGAKTHTHNAELTPVYSRRLQLLTRDNVKAWLESFDR